MIHRNVCFLILLICCWVVAASLMAEKTNVGVAIVLAMHSLATASLPRRLETELKWFMF